MLDKQQYEKLFTVFSKLGVEATTITHYDLAEKTEINDYVLWREFLLDPRTTDWRKTEMSIIKQGQINKIIHSAADSKSVGNAQIINAFANMDKDERKKDGPAFIYTHVPLNKEQEHSKAVQKINNIIK